MKTFVVYAWGNVVDKAETRGIFADYANGSTVMQVYANSKHEAMEAVEAFAVIISIREVE